jgi:hypothetical protein
MQAGLLRRFALRNDERKKAHRPQTAGFFLGRNDIRCARSGRQTCPASSLVRQARGL